MAVTKKRGRKPLNPTGPMSGAERMRKFREQRRGDGFQTLERAWSRATAEGRAKFRDAVLAADGVKGA